ncbi:DUF2993 domain-containing protein [Actinoplanes sp. NPDC051851]|uniref:LmeA family phospholipid-binding protein n=1 Tax=Actinoplanes sp. NPDC051851 TaxID=3154753 RepID=UPI003415012A
MSEVYETPEYRPRRRRGRGLLIVVLVLLVLLIAGVVAVDRFGRSYAERMLADRVSQQIAEQKATSDTPDVSIEGFPFVTQVLAGDYQEIRIGIGNLTGPTGTGDEITIDQLDITVADLNAPLSALRSGQGDVVAGSLTGAFDVGYDELVKLSGQDGVTLTEQDGKLIATAEITKYGVTVDASATAEISVDDGEVQVRFSDVTAKNLPDIPLLRAYIQSYAKSLAFDVPVPELPLSLKVRSVDPQDDGLHVTAGADDVNLSANGL